MRIVRMVVGICALSIGASADSVLGQQPQSPDRPAAAIPTVEATEIEEAAPAVVAESFEAPAPRHPPIHTIPPMPMPARGAVDETRSLDGPGVPVSFDLSTREESPGDASAFDGAGRSQFDFEGGYTGIHGGQAEEQVPARFGDMRLIAPALRREDPWRRNVKIVMRYGSSFFVCSGTMLDAEVVLTAGHCVYDNESNAWADAVWVYPGWDGAGTISTQDPGVQHYGAGVAASLHSITGWIEREDSNYDIGEIVLTRAVGMLTGWFGTRTGGICSAILPNLYYNASYPAASCGSGLHTGRDMYYWNGHFDSCPETNLLQIDNSGSGCLSVLWGGMSGSGAYARVNEERYVHAVVSHSNQIAGVDVAGNYAKLYAGWRENVHDDVVAEARGSTFDLQALAARIDGPTIVAAGATTVVHHIAVNPTDASASREWTFRVYLSTNNNISASDTWLSTWNYSRNFDALDWTRVRAATVRIPASMPPGTYFLGVAYDSGTDSNADNNATDAWDATRITIVPGTGGPGGGTFTDDPIVPGTTVVKAVHITELRDRIDALRGNHGLSAFPWTDRTIISGVTRIRGVHLTELRAALDGAYDAARLSRPPYTGTVLAGSTGIRAVHINELRRAVERLE